MNKRFFLRTLLFSAACIALAQEKTWAADENEIQVASVSRKRRTEQTTLCFSPTGAPAINMRELYIPEKKLKADSAKAYHNVTALFKTAVDAQENDRILGFLRNMLYVAVTGKTSAEIVNERAWYTKSKMGFKTSQHVTLKKSGIAKNYLTPQEVSQLTNLSNDYLAYNGQRQGGQPSYLSEWKNDLSVFFTMKGLPVYSGDSGVCSQTAKAHAEKQYRLFRKPLGQIN